jgi:hypothetical protein
MSHPFLFLIPTLGNVPTKCKKNRALGRWVSTQRAMYKTHQEGAIVGKDGSHSQENERRIARLEELGFSFSMIPGPAGNDGNAPTSDSDTTTAPKSKSKRHASNSGKEQ